MSILNYIRAVLGNYTQLSGDNIATLNIEYIVSAIIFIMSIWFILKLILSFFYRN